MLARVYFARGQYAEARHAADQAFDKGQAIGNIGAIRTGAILAIGARLELGEQVNLGRYIDAIALQSRFDKLLLLRSERQRTLAPHSAETIATPRCGLGVPRRRRGT